MRELDLWNAERLDGVLTGGRTSPLIVDCSPTSADSSLLPLSGRKSFVVKAIGLPEVTQRGLFCEAFGNLLARELGLETPRPALIAIDAAFVNANASSLAAYNIQIKPGLGVGCEYFKGGFAGIIPDAFRTADEMIQAGRVFGFDLLAQNPDRRPDKPNCAYLKGNLMAFDFELAFSFLLLIGQEGQAWEVSKHGIAPKHLFFKKLRGMEMDWKAFTDTVSKLNGAQLAQVMQGLPGQWQPWTAKVQQHLLTFV